MTSEVLDIGDCKILVERFGEGPPLLLLHGENGPHGAKPLIAALAKSFEVHVPRHAGWAGSTRAHHVQTTRDLALVAQEYAERFPQPVPAVGLSFGGWVAAEVAATAPKLFSSIVLVSPIGVKIGDRETRDFLDTYVLAAGDREAAYYSPDGRPTVVVDTEGDYYLDIATAEEATVRFCWQPFMHDTTLKGRLRRVEAPTLILSGSEDGFILNPDYYRGYAGLIPGAAHEVIAGVGHRIEEERPEAVADRIADFVKMPMTIAG